MGLRKGVELDITSCPNKEKGDVLVGKRKQDDDRQCWKMDENGRAYITSSSNKEKEGDMLIGKKK